jgi:hypothetical protein
LIPPTHPHCTTIGGGFPLPPSESSLCSDIGSRPRGAPVAGGSLVVRVVVRVLVLVLVLVPVLVPVLAAPAAAAPGGGAFVLAPWPGIEIMSLTAWGPPSDT